MTYTTYVQEYGEDPKPEMKLVKDMEKSQLRITIKQGFSDNTIVLDFKDSIKLYLELVTFMSTDIIENANAKLNKRV